MNQNILTKYKNILLYFQMFLIILLLITSIYLLVFVLKNKLGGWMITSYIFITISVLTIICYSIIGYKKGEIAFLISLIPFLVAIFINILLPNRVPFQVAILVLLILVTFGFLLKQNDKKIGYIFSLLMVVIALVFSIYSSITANVKFLGDISKNWPTYLAMYLSIFIPTIMSGTFALIYSIKISE